MLELAPDLSYLERLLGDVLFEGEIARTSRAVVYRVHTGSTPGRRSMALKVALAPSDAEDLVRFRHEVRLLSEARHPNVLEVYDFGVLPGGFPFLTMELLAGNGLVERFRAGNWEEVYDLAIQAAAGLAHIHRQGVVHMDIKPQNLGLVGGTEGAPVLKILDFGLAQATLGPLDRRIRGTLAYTAPEVLLQDRYDHRADLYSLGMTLLELVTGVLPSAGDELAAIRFHLEGELPDPRRLRPDLPPGLARVLSRLLRRDPAERYSSAGQLLADLGSAAGRRIDAAEVALSGGSMLASRLIGREPILERLRSDLAAAAEGRGGVVLIEGAEGVGKSRLLREFRLFAAIGGAQVGRGSGTAENPQPLGSFRQTLGSLGIELGTGFEAPEGETDPRARYRLYREIALRIADRSAAGAPLVLLLDDLHLDGREGEELLTLLAEELRTRKALVVASRRTVQEASQKLDALPVLSLPPLDRVETTHLVDACLGGAGLPASFYGWIFERSAGIPGEIHLLLRHLVEDQVLLYREGEWKPSLAALSRWAGSTDTLESKEWQRIAALPAGDREVLEGAAIVAEPFSLETLTALLEGDSQIVYERLSTLVSQSYLELLQEAGGTRYVLSQRRFQQFLYAGIETERRVLLHRRLAVLLEERLLWGEENLDVAVAEHFWRAGERVRSLPYLLRAAEKTSSIYGHTQAAGFYGRAAEAAAEAGDPEMEVRALISQADALSAAGSYQRALRICESLLGQPDLHPSRSRDGIVRARMNLRKGRLHSRLGEHEAALDSYREGLLQAAGLGEEKAEAEIGIDLLHGEAVALRDLADWDSAFSTARLALARAGRGGHDRQRATLLNFLGMMYSRRGDWRRAGRLLRRGLRVAEGVGDEALSLKLRNNLGNVLFQTGDYEPALAHYSRNLAFCERTHDLWGEYFALNNLGTVEGSRGNWKGAREPFLRSLELTRRLGARENEVRARLNLGEAEEVLGSWPRAQRHYERALKLLDDSPDHPERFAALVQLASLERKRGWGLEAERRAREALEGAERLEDRDLLAQSCLQLGLIEKDRENLEAAEGHLLRARELAENVGTPQVLTRVCISLADLTLHLGKAAEAEWYAQEARRRLEELGDRFLEAKLLSVDARLASARDEVDRAEKLFAAGVRLLEELEAPYEHARSLYEWGLRTWNVDTSLRRLRRALAGFDRLGAEAESKRTSGAIERIREHQRFSGGRGASTVLYEVIKVINSTLDLQKVLDRTMDLVLERLGAERGMIVFSDPLTRELEVAVARNLGREDEEEERKLSESVVRKVIEGREPILAVDALSDGRFTSSESIIARHIVSILCVPLAIRNRLVGAIYIDHRQSSHVFGQGDLEFLAAFADQAAIAIENARLYGEIEAARLRLKEENDSLRREVLSSHNLSSLIGKSQAISALKQTIERVARNPSTVLIRGESGTGKGLVARIIHSISPRRQAPFIHFNCAALPETLVESELFGHEKGAFTGAAGQKPGRFELAHHGTIFLDEIGKVSRSVQAKLLRVVEEKEFERVGGTRTLRADVRIIAATNLDLEDAISRNEFREDLFYRLNIIPIVLPPLRERREDIPYLVQHFLAKISRDLGRSPKELDPAVLDLFYAHAWPGNVRELEAAIHRAFVLAANEDLTLDDFGWIALHAHGAQGAAARPPEVGGLQATVRLAGGGYEEALDRYDRQLIVAALAQCGGKIRETSRLLGIARNTLRAKMKRYSLQASGE